MSVEQPLVLVMLPPRAAALSARVLAAGAQPVIDLSEGGAVPSPWPSGAWVRVRPDQEAAGEAGVVYTDPAPPLAGRPTWLELTEPGEVQPEIAGVILRGQEAGGRCGTQSGMRMVQQQGGERVLDAGLGPVQAAEAVASGARGVVLREQLYALDGLLGPKLQSKAARLGPGASKVVQGVRVCASSLSPVVRSLVAGQEPETLWQDWADQDDPVQVAWPAGQGVEIAGALADAHGSLEGVLGAFQQALAPKVSVAAAVTPMRTPTVAPQAAATPQRQELIAVVGLGCVLPDAPDIPTFWSNLQGGHNSIREVPVERWDPGLFWESERGVPDRTYSKIGGFVREMNFKARDYRIPPKMAAFIDGVQKMTLVAVKEALQDAGVTKDSAVDRSRVAVILGNAMGGTEHRDQSVLRVHTQSMCAVLAQTPEVKALPLAERQALVAAFGQRFRDSLPPITEDSMPGELSNVVAGRVTNAFDLGGPNFTVDAACASSMAAVQAAMKGLQDGDFDMAVTGGADRSMDAPTYAKFSAIGALSHDRSSPFDEGANGFVMGEGCGILVLKRLSDAERDGDRVYAVIRGMGASSDGKGKGITAPNIEGQRRALRRAYADAAMDPVEVDLLECHGTSTVVGDRIEVTALSEVIGQDRRGARGPIRIGSVKSQIGHLKSAAGAAAMIKTVLALHHKVLPPSINFRSPRTDAPMDAVPLQVQTHAEPWHTQGWVRSAGVSAFGFGGTNFHAVLQEHLPAAAPAKPTPKKMAKAALTAERLLPEGIWATSGRDLSHLLRNLDRIEAGESAPFRPDHPLRLAAAADSEEEQRAQIAKVRKAAVKGKGWDLLRMRQIHLEDTPADGKLAFVFTGQGSQYIGMGLDLFERYPLVETTFMEADKVIVPELGRSILDYVRGIHEDPQESFDALRATEVAQPSTLALDIALLRVLSGYGLFPDMVAGHSLGEYGALVAAGVTDFWGALQAVTARGKEMAGIKIDDPGTMAGVAASAEVVSEVLVEVEGYVIAANKNSPKQTVIAGATLAVEAASEVFRSRDITVVPLPVSHAFHSAIVAPASEPLKRVLERCNIQAPSRPITSNVTSRWYPNSVPEIIDLLSEQVAAPVEWVNQVERMYADGARIFVEIGPKRALTGMITTILKGRPHRVLNTNHPKVGGERSLRDSLAGLIALGFPIKQDAGTEVVDLLQSPRPRLSTSAALAHAQETPGELQATPYVVEAVFEAVARRAGLDRESLEPDLEMEADLGIDTVRQAELVAELRSSFKLEREAGFLLSDHASVRDLVDYFAGRLGQFEPRWNRSAPALATQPRGGAAKAPAAPAARAAPAGSSQSALSQFLVQAAELGLKGADAQAFAQALLPAVQGLLDASFREAQRLMPPAPSVLAAQVIADPVRSLVVVCSGAAVGLPGGTQVFDADNIQSVLRGDNRITAVPAEYRRRFLDKGIVRLVKDASGQGSFLPVERDDQVIHLAGQAQHFDIAEYGVPARLSVAFDRATNLAIAAAIEALADAQIPLVRTYRETTTGKRVPTGWALPESMRDNTGVVFASAFPGYNNMAEKLQGGGLDENGNFDRRFLFQVLAMGHSQIAQLLGARGPNTQVNSACASTTQAVSIAEDWLRLGRCDRVIVVGADDVTSPALLEWMGSGFLAAGAATTESKVEDAALPFDERRHGMILGMGAVGLIIERQDSVQARGMIPVAELVASSTGNSAFHGSRLDVTHIQGQVKALVAKGAKKEGMSPEQMGRSALFMSHETYTPARGGSSAAEMAALRAAFGSSASQVIITNTKGFTGHPMGAGIEDAIAIKALQYGKAPPIPNLLYPDPELGDLNLSKGGAHSATYALRLAAGFGSQLSLGLWKKVAEGDERIADAGVYRAWLAQATGIGEPELVVEDRTLRVIGQVLQGGASKAAPKAAAAKVAAPQGITAESVLAHLMGVIGEKTGYDDEDLDPDYELEADLGIDTVKQAEIFSEVRDHYGIERDDSFSLADYPTVRGLAGWLNSQIGAVAVPSDSSEPSQTPELEATPEPAAPKVQAADVLAHLLDVISEKTGYDHEDLDVDYELEADLGIDTVKQAEIFSEVRDYYGVERDDSFSLADYSTIKALAGWLSEQVTAAPAAAPAPEQAAPEPTPAAAPTSEATAAPVTRSAEVLETLLRVIGEKTGYDREDLDLDYELEADLGIDTVKQAEIFSEVRDQFGVERDDDFSLADYPTIGGLAAWLGERVQAGSPTPPPAPAGGDGEDVADPLSELPPTFWIRRPVRLPRPLSLEGSLNGRVVMVLGDGPVANAMVEALQEQGASVDGIPDAVVDVAADVFSTFRTAKSLVEGDVRDWLCLTMMGEMDGMTPDQAFFDGSRAGFTKALGREWEGCTARVVDISPQLEPERIAQLLCKELAASDGTVEVFHSYDGKRRVIELAVEDSPASLVPPDANQVVIVTGGGRGVTSRVAFEFARRTTVTLVLVGRSPAGTEVLDEKAEKARVRAELKAAGERATPAQIEQQLGRLRKAEEIRRNVEGLRELGATVEYRTCDMADVSAVQQLVSEVQSTYGRVDGCIHGAGVEESRLIQDKDEAGFHRVFDGKALGGLALVEAMPEDTWLLSMGSVAGRFGNAGQVDYSAANEAMAQICLSRPRSVHVDWTAWGDVGMAVRGGMQNLLEQRGVELLPASSGACLAVDLIAAGVEGEVVVAGKLGELVPSPNHPLLDSVEHEGRTVVARYALDQDRDPWILDHAIDKVPVLPGVVGLELMAAAASLASPGSTYVGVEDLSFEKPVKLYRGEPCELEMRAEPTTEGRVRCSLLSERVTRGGKRLRTLHYTAEILLQGKPELSAMPPAFFPEEPVTRGEIYRRFFHGPAFQVLRGADAVTRDGLLASARVEHSYIAEGLITSPLALEAAFQAAGLHAMIAQGSLALPASVETVWMARTVRDGEDLSVTVQQREDGAYDMDLDGEDGRLMSVRGFHMVEKGPLPERDRFPEPEEGWEESAFGEAVVVVPRTGPDAALADAAVGEDSTAWLNEEELAVLCARGTAKRQADRIAGRVAAKRAIQKLTGAGPERVRVLTLASGAPKVTIDGKVGPALSISHSGGHAVALASHHRRVGVDLEQVEARHPAFLEEWFSEQERRVLEADPYRVTVAWSAKEAVLKALGQGMALNPREVHVVAIAERDVVVSLSGSVAQAHQALGGAPVRVELSQSAYGVLVRASFAA